MPPSRRQKAQCLRQAEGIATATASSGVRSVDGCDGFAEHTGEFVLRFEDLITTKQWFTVAGFGNLRGTTTYLAGHLIGKSVSINNSAWPGYSSGSSLCVIGVFVRDLKWLSTIPIACQNATRRSRILGMCVNALRHSCIEYSLNSIICTSSNKDYNTVRYTIS